MRKNKNNRLIYVIGGGNDCGYANWLQGTGFTKNIKEADLCLGLGGSDVGAHYYNQPDSGRLYCDEKTDALEYADFQTAIKLGKKIIGICKSSQWGAALAGGAVYQDVRHPGIHEVTTFDGKILEMNSTHHNMQDVSNLKESEDYELLAWANLSPYHYNGYNQNVKCEKEPEVVWYKKINFLAFQNHNESLYGDDRFNETIKWSQDILNKFMSNSLI
jgi:hypothetical protein